MRFEILAACLLSVLVHAWLFWFVPLPAFPRSPQEQPPAVVELVTVDIPEPSVGPPLSAPILSPAQVGGEPQSPASTEAPPQPEAVAPLQARAEPLPAVVTYDARQIRAPDLQHINSTIEQVGGSASAPLTLPPLQLPTQSRVEALPDLPLPPVEDVTPRTMAMLAPSVPTAGAALGLEKQLASGQIPMGEKQRPGNIGLPTLDQKLLPQTVPAFPPLPTEPASGPSAGIYGPIAKREAVVRPPLPKVQGQAESEITLKFWVRPDGVVSRVLPERKGDTALEVAAIRYLEGWRFTPLPPYEQQVEQWGTITVRFRLPER
jgi:TonB family protein